MNARRLSQLILAVAALAFVFVGALRDGTARTPEAAAPAQSATHEPSAPSADTKDGPWYPVAKVVDGDTLEVRKDGGIVKVRLIGINTPETVDPRRSVQCFGREASAEAHRLLDGQSVSLETDPSQDTYDKYGRLLAYVYLPDGTLFNERMIAAGFAHEYTYNVPYKYQAQFKAAEQAAREARRGLWSPETCAGDTNRPA